MKKMNVLNLIKYHTTSNNIAFKNEAIEIANDFDKNGDFELAQYIMALITDGSSFVPQMNENELTYLSRVKLSKDPLPLPEAIEKDIAGIINSINRNVGVNKFLFYGKPGTGKTETAKEISRILNRDLYIVNFSSLIDSKLGQTQKNITELFKEINECRLLNKIIILFDELDALVLDRTNSNDLREMGRVTSTFLKELDSLNDNAIIIATTNLYSYFDKAILRRFDYKVSFDRYTLDDLKEIGESIFNFYSKKYKDIGKNIKLFKKIIGNMDPILTPGELKNAIKTSLAFSSDSSPFDYLSRLYLDIVKSTLDLKTLQEQGFTIREIETLTGVSKSQVSRNLRRIKG